MRVVKEVLSWFAFIYREANVKLARVIGTVVSTQKDRSLEGLKILMIQPLTHEHKPSGGPIAAIDVAQAGPNDLVFWIMAREAALALPDPFSPVDATIVGIVDQVNAEKTPIKDKEKIFLRE